MRNTIIGLALFVAIGIMAGCGRAPIAEPQPPKAEGPLEYNLSELLAKPRAELAGLAEQELIETQKQEELNHQGQLSFLQLPEVRLPVVVPGLGEAKFSLERGISLPPYVAATAKDNALARHLAQFGDLDGALKLADASEYESLKKLHGQVAERNYPIEWTRLVALHLHASQVQLATGEARDPAKLVQLHQQVRDVLDVKAQKSSLGAALLPRGRGVLKEAARVWRSSDQQEAARKAEDALVNWGEMPPPVVPVPPGSPKADVVNALAETATGRVLLAPSIQRAIDMLQLPLPAREVDAVLAAFDNDDRLTELFVTLRPRLAESCPKPSQLLYLINEQTINSVDVGDANWPRVIYDLGERRRLEAGLAPLNPGVGGYVRLYDDPKHSITKTFLTRVTGPIDLDRSFEQTRLAVLPSQRGKLLTVDDPAILSQLAPAPAEFKRQALLLERPAEFDVLQRWTLRLEPNAKRSRLAAVSLPLWAIAGAPRVEGVGGRETGMLVLFWADAHTRMELRLPNTAGKGAELTVSDLTRADQFAERFAKVLTRDQAERVARFEAGKVQALLPRELDQVKLGMDSDQVKHQFAGDTTAHVRPLADGWRVTFTKQETSPLGLLVQELYARCDSAKVVELRVRYANASAQNGLAKLHAQFVQAGGAPEVLPSPWVALWSDLPVDPAPLLQRWQDDRTIATWQQDAFGIEVTLRDRPSDQEDAVALPALSYLARGPEGCLLGSTKAELLKAWNVKNPEFISGALVLTPKAGGPYDALLVWFEKDRVVRVVARHRQRAEAKAGQAGPAAGGAAVTEAWGRDLTRIGFPRRQDQGQGAPQSWATHDDCTRYRVFWQLEGDTPIVFSEWKSVGEQ